MTVSLDSDLGDAAPTRSRRRLPRAFNSWAARIASLMLLFLLAIAFLGSWIAPHSQSALIGPPYEKPSAEFMLGTDYLGEDVFSRVLYGGRYVIVFALIATVFAYLIGGSLGLIAGFSRSIVDPVIMRAADVMLAFPALFLILLLASRFGAGPTVVIVGISLIHIPYIARIVRIATQDVSVRGFVEAAVARGDSTFSILRREILPNIWGPISADAGPRLTISILLVAGLNFLGIGLSPPTADWAVMISENRSGLTLNHWAVTVPALMIALLTVSVNVLADAIARSRGHSIDETFRR